MRRFATTVLAVLLAIVIAVGVASTVSATNGESPEERELGVFVWIGLGIAIGLLLLSTFRRKEV